MLTNLFRSSSSRERFLIVGLGNPTPKYQKTRHNAGFLAVDYIANKLSVSSFKKKFDALFAMYKSSNADIYLLKPQTYMNRSGQSVDAAAKFYKIPPKNIIVVYDDVSLAVGKMRIRGQGSPGGHNGILSICGYLGDNFPRIKIGVGERPNKDYDLADWVLSNFTDKELKELADIFDNSYRAAMLIVEGDMQKAQNLYN